MEAYKHEIVTKDKALPAFVFLHDSQESVYFDTHWHQSVELSFTLEGQIDDFCIDGKSYQTEPGSVLLVNSMVPHSIRVHYNSQSPSRGLTIIYPYAIISSYFPAIDAYQFQLNDKECFGPKQLEHYQILQEKLRQVAVLYAGSDKLSLSILLLEILRILLDHFLEKRQLSAKKPTSISLTERIQFIKSYIDAHYQADIGLGSIATVCFLSKAHLARFFKTYMGVSLETYIGMVRARHAREAILDNKKTFTQIAGACGFSGLRTMNRALLAHYGQTAREMKNELEQRDTSSQPLSQEKEQ